LTGSFHIRLLVDATKYLTNRANGCIYDPTPSVNNWRIP
jgi:hypothetical protein